MNEDRVERTDEELVEDYLDGEVGAFRALIERYHDPLLRFLTRLMGDVQAAEDAFQDTFLKVHQSLDSFDTARTFKPWLFTIAANQARDNLRKSKRRSMVSLSAQVGGDADRSSLVDLMEIDLPGPELRLEEQERAEMVQRAIDAMPLRLRETLLLAYFQRMTYAQIAEVLGIPIGTVKSRLHAAVAAFARRWQEQVDQRASDKTNGASSSGNP